MNKNIKDDSFSPEVKKQIRKAQVNEVTEYHIYKHLSRIAKLPENRVILNRIADEELEHYRFWMDYNDEVEPRWWEMRLYIFISGFLGMVFALKLMEKAEASAQKNYKRLAEIIPGISKIIQDEINHEKTLINMLSDLRLKSFGTWMTAMNLVLFSLSGMVILLTVLTSDLVFSGNILVLTALTVALADSLNTIFLRNTGQIRGELLYRAFKRFLSGLLIGAIVSCPYYMVLNPWLAVAISLGVLMLSGFLLNFYYAVISDHPVPQKSGRVFLGYLIITGMIFGVAYLLRFVTGV